MSAGFVRLILLSVILDNVHSACDPNKVKCSKDDDCCDVDCIKDAPTRYCELNVESFMALVEEKIKVSVFELMEIVEDHMDRSSPEDLDEIRSLVAGNADVSDSVKSLLGVEEAGVANETAAGGEGSMYQEMFEELKQNPEMVKEFASDPELREMAIQYLSQPETIEKIQKYIKENPQVLIKALNHLKADPGLVHNISIALHPYRPEVYKKLDALLDQHKKIRAALVALVAADPEAREIFAKILGRWELYKLLSPINSAAEVGSLAGKGIDLVAPPLAKTVVAVAGKGVAKVGAAAAGSETFMNTVNKGAGLVLPALTATRITATNNKVSIAVSKGFKKILSKKSKT